MSYQVLARKWRPQTFADVVGQEHVLTALANGLSLGRIHHAYLFSGTRGVGKTSIARLLAKGLNCETGITATPCGVCDNCREIEQGRFVDLIEIDAASRTKVEDTRDLLDNVQYAPARGRFKVYLIDEVHMLSRHSFNALLKTLEEPPAHVKFLLATTDPQKLPVTILSRCLQFHLKALDVEQIRHQLEHILGEEQIAFEPRALQLLSRAADGSLRDALSLTDQAIASGEGQLTAASVSTMLGTLDDDQALSLIEALVAADGERVMAGVNDAAARGVEWEALLVEMQSLLHRIAMVQLSPSALGADMAAVEVRMRELARTVPPGDVQLYYQTLLIGRKELPYAPDRRMGVEMTLLRALAFHPRKPLPEPEVQPAQAAAPASVGDMADEIIPMEGMRKLIADNMQASLQNAAQLTVFVEADVTEMVALREAMLARHKKDPDYRLSYNDIICFAVCRALKQHPIMNSTLQADGIHLHKHVNLGVAVSLETGLIVPNVKNAEACSLEELKGQVRDVAKRARQGGLSMDEIQGGSFTISNVSMLGVDGFTPIINPPETAILGVGRVVEKAGVAEGVVCPRKMMTLSLTFNHMVTDGGPAMNFLRTLADMLEKPVRMLG